MLKIVPYLQYLDQSGAVLVQHLPEVGFKISVKLKYFLVFNYQVDHFMNNVIIQTCSKTIEAFRTTGVLKVRWLYEY